MIVVADKKLALYWGCWREPGHYLYRQNGETFSMFQDYKKVIPGFCWDIGLLDTGLLKNGKHSDVYDGQVFWTCGGTPLWIAFFWWDNSVDHRSGSNSGFYVNGFYVEDLTKAFQFACETFPFVVQRQRQPLRLVHP